MKAKLSRIRLRDLALFVVIAGAVAVTTVCGAQEIGLDGEEVGARTEQSQSGLAQTQQDQEQGQATEALTLTLTGPGRCTTTRGQSYGVDEAVYDDEGNHVRTERRFVGHYEVRQFSVSWSVSGGDGPYALKIDGAAEDESGPFTGANGQGMAYCTNTTVPSFVDDAGDRALRANPMIDSGTKTVRAVVTDANGRTAESTINVYVIPSIGDGGAPLSAGETYRVNGHLLTIPDGVRASIGGQGEEVCEGQRCEAWFDINLEGDDFLASTTFGAQTGREIPNGRWIQLKDGARGGSEAEGRRQEIDRLLDELSDSAGVEPTAEGGP